MDSKLMYFDNTVNLAYAKVEINKGKLQSEILLY
jgi:hypothetical protein